MSTTFGRPTNKSTSTNATTAVDGEVANDIQLATPPEDSISYLSWSPAANHLAVASWDNKVRIYDVSHKSSGEGRALIHFDAPVLSCTWSKVCRVFLSPTTRS